MSGLWRNNSETPEGKYPIVLRRDGSAVTKPYFLIMASDPAARAALVAYADEAERQGWDAVYVADIRAMAMEFEHFNRTHGQGDPDAPRHRKDDPAILAWARSAHTRSA